MARRRKLIVGRHYPVERLTSGKRDEETRLQVMEYLGEFGEVFLFRHPAGYRESFMKKDLGIQFLIHKQRKTRVS
ncbi:MAG: hypothetical protein Q4A78_08710 [Peptostreptococcaceae bacterium]|nr:hypothetical protein [Peptostreptococcaceae bacterium]